MAQPPSEGNVVGFYFYFDARKVEHIRIIDNVFKVLKNTFDNLRVKQILFDKVLINYVFFDYYDNYYSTITLLKKMNQVPARDGKLVFHIFNNDNEHNVFVYITDNVELVLSSVGKVKDVAFVFDIH